jgi:hypothetical protein
VITKAQVIVMNEKTKVKVSGETDASGRLRLADLPAGKHEVTVLAPGFKTLKRSHVSVPSKTLWELQLEVGVMMGEVVVVGKPEVEPKSSPVCKTLSDPSSEKPK